MKTRWIVCCCCLRRLEVQDRPKAELTDEYEAAFASLDRDGRPVVPKAEEDQPVCTPCWEVGRRLASREIGIPLATYPRVLTPASWIGAVALGREVPADPRVEACVVQDGEGFALSLPLTPPSPIS